MSSAHSRDTTGFSNGEGFLHPGSKKRILPSPYVIRIALAYCIFHTRRRSIPIQSNAIRVKERTGILSEVNAPGAAEQWGTFAFAYLTDIIICSSTYQEHLLHLALLFERCVQLRTYGLGQKM